MSSDLQVDLGLDLLFFMCGIVWLYLTQRLINIYTPVTDVTCYSSEEDTRVGREKKKKEFLFL